MRRARNRKPTLEWRADAANALDHRVWSSERFQGAAASNRWLKKGVTQRFSPFSAT